MDKVVAARPRRSRTSPAVVARGRWVRAVRDPVGAHRRAARAGVDRPRGGVEQLRRRRVGPRAAAVRQADPPDDLVLRRGEQGVRPAVPPRRARGRADARRARSPSGCGPAARASRPSSPRPASAPRSPRAGCPGSTTRTARSPWPRRPRRCGPSRPPRGRRTSCSRTRSSRLRAGAGLEGRPARQPRLPAVRPQLQPAGGDVRPGHHRRGRAPRGARRARPRTTCTPRGSSCSGSSR